jgi:ribonuclease G
MADDKAKHNILPISQLGIMQITRQRHDESNSSGIYEPCPYCNGRGIVKSPRAVSIEIQRKITSVARKVKEENANSEVSIKIFLHPSTLRRLRGPDSKLIDRMERNYGLKLNFEAAETYHVESFKLIDETTSNEIR